MFAAAAAALRPLVRKGRIARFSGAASLPISTGITDRDAAPLNEGITGRDAAFDDWGPPRREGYEYKWARVGANSKTMLSAGQHTGLAQQVNDGLVSHAVMAIGQNDFFIGSPAYIGIYSGLWSQDKIDTYTEDVLGNIHAALKTLLATDVKLVLSNVVDYGVAPLTRLLYGNPDRRDRVADVIDRLNQGGISPRKEFVFDGVHPHTVPQAVFANLFIEGLSLGYTADVAKFTEAEMVGLVGLPYKGEDTLPIDYSKFVVLPTVDNPAGVGDLVWRDLDGDGIQEDGEPGVEGVRVELLSAGSDGLIGGVDDVLARATTVSTGRRATTISTAARATTGYTAGLETTCWSTIREVPLSPGSRAPGFSLAGPPATTPTTRP